MAAPNRLVTVFATPVLDTAIFASGDSLHTADMTFDRVVQEEAGSGLIKSVVILDRDAEGANLELWLFTRALANTTHTANSAWNLHDSDLPYFIDAIPVGTWYAGSANKVGISAQNLDIPFKCEADTTKLYGVLVTRATPTYTAAGDITVGIRIDRG